MDVMSALTAIPGIGPYLPYLLLAVAIATFLCPVLPAPTDKTGFYFAVYQVINSVACNFGHAKNLSAPESLNVVGGPGAISNPQTVNLAPVVAPPRPGAPSLMPLFMLVMLLGALTACAADGTATPQVQAIIRGFCLVDGVVQPIAVTVVPTLAPQTTPLAAIDAAAIHPAVVAGCAKFGGTAIAAPVPAP